MSVIHGRVRGKVQGVWFRRETKRQADRLSLRGWVQNETDGSVSFTACGEPAALAEFRQWLAHGPPRARVDSLDIEEMAVEELPPAGSGSAFEIRR